MPSNSSEGRRAAQATAAPMDNDQEERNACLKKVQARDLVEFGMIPVSCDQLIDTKISTLTRIFCILGICWSISGSCTFSQSRR